MWPIVLGEAWVEMPPGADTAALSEAGAIVTESRRPDDRIRILLDERTALALERAGFRLSDRRADHRLPVPLPGYHTPESGDALLDTLAAASPRAGRVRIGTSVEGRPIEGIWLGQEPGTGAPAVRVLGAHHGDEPTSYEVSLAFVERLATTDGADPAVTALLDRSTVWAVPLVNPDGLVAGTRMSSTGVDLNRNYDWAWSPSEPGSGPAPFSEPETRAIRALGSWNRPYVALTLHAGVANLGWPWNHTIDPAADATALESLATRYAETCTAPEFWLTQGSHWYLSRGDTNDWAYGRHGTFDLTLEVSAEQTPPAEQLPAIAAQHVDAMIALLGTLPSVEGTITDAATGEPLEAMIDVSGGATFRSDPLTGRYAQIAAPEPSALLTANADGYLTTGIGIPTDGPVPVVTDLVLEPSAIGEGFLLPSVLRWAGPAIVLGAGDGPVVLRHATADPIELFADDDVVLLDPAAMAPGAWSAEVSDATIVPRALWVDDRNPATIDAWHDPEPDGVLVTGTGFGAGASAIGFVGRTRTMVPVAVTVESETALWLEMASLPSEDRVDVAVWTNGSLLGIDDVWTPRTIEWPEEEDLFEEGTGCSCSHGPRGILPAWIPLALCLLVQMRPRRFFTAFTASWSAIS